VLHVAWIAWTLLSRFACIYGAASVTRYHSSDMAVSSALVGPSRLRHWYPKTGASDSW